MFVVLRTLDELKAFWSEHREQFSYSSEGIQYGDEQQLLNAYEWVFGPSKAAVVKTVFRWDQVGIRCQWYDWATESPEDHVSFYLDRDHSRKALMVEARWREHDEVQYQDDSKRYAPETDRGWWRLANLPANCSDLDWFGNSHEEINDPNLPLEFVARAFQEQTFDDWKAGGEGEIDFHGTQSLDKVVAYWRGMRRCGQDYYGRENEAVKLQDGRDVPRRQER